MVSITGSPTGPGMKSSDRNDVPRATARGSILKHSSTKVNV
jgi:hypothetical protein